jgi:hypothetical protein
MTDPMADHDALDKLVRQALRDAPRTDDSATSLDSIEQCIRDIERGRLSALEAVVGGTILVIAVLMAAPGVIVAIGSTVERAAPSVRAAIALIAAAAVVLAIMNALLGRRSR